MGCVMGVHGGMFLRAGMIVFGFGVSGALGYLVSRFGSGRVEW